MTTYTLSGLSKFRARFPVRLNFWLVLGWIGVLYYFAYQYHPRLPDAGIFNYPLINLLVIIAFWFVLTVFLFSTATVFFCFLIFQFGKKTLFNNILESGVKNVKSGFIKGNIPVYLKPLLGKLQAMIWYHERNQRPTFIHKIPIGKFTMELPIVHIRVYTVQEMDLLFLDFLRMYRLPAALYSVSTFSREPSVLRMEEQPVAPRVYHEENTTTDQVLYHPGEWLQFKTYETGDDVRRILWKLYAKSKDLYVRHQEHYTQHSSRITLVVFFELDTYFYKYINPTLLQFLLDKYKNMVYTIYKKLTGLHKDLELVVHHSGKANTDEEVKNLIAASEWQTTHHHIELPERSHLILHSLIPPGLIQAIEEAHHQDISVIPLVHDLLIKKTDRWWWRWLFKKKGGKAPDIQDYLPVPKALQQLKKEEAERMDQLRQLNYN